MNGKDITIIIITYNRYPYLLRLLKFYDNYDHDFKFLILDSSSHELNDNTLMKYLDKKNVKYKKYESSILFAHKIARGCKSINTPFSVICADDDFLIPAGILESRDFLLSNNEYSSAHGLYFQHQNSKQVQQNGFMIGPMSNKILSTEQATGIQRIQAYLSGETSHYPLYAVHRTTTFCSIWNATKKYVSDWGLSEIFPCCISFAYGKMKVLPVFYSSREPNTMKSNHTDDRINSMYSKERLALASKGIGQYLNELDGLNLNDGFNLIQIELNKYLARSKTKRRKSLNKKMLFWNLLRKNIALRSRIKKLFFHGCDFSIYPKYFEDYKKLRITILDANLTSELLNISRRET